ncbi:hypothetical protein [Bradyrhizobium sp. OAE829]|uniref:hypothetical protein n=1 Tax=Bradyrhizobium sp. OAE829 TaxID=2663807 RepID=UPI00178ABC9C
MRKFIAYAVDLSGVALLADTGSQTAEREVRQYLENNPAIEIWSHDHRCIARLVRAARDLQRYGRIMLEAGPQLLRIVNAENNA